MAATKQSTIDQVVDLILDGKVDDDFDTIYNAVRERRRMIDLRKKLQFKKRQKVTISEMIRGNLKGAEGTIEEINPVNVVVRITACPRNPSFVNRRYNFAPSLLEKAGK